MPAFEYEKEGIVTDVYGRFAIAIGFNMNGRVLIRADSLCLKLRNSSAGSNAKEANNGNGSFTGSGPHDNDTTAAAPNLAKSLAVGDQIQFDAVAINDTPVKGTASGIRWLGAPGSVRLLQHCTRTQTFIGCGNIIQVAANQGILAYADKRISLEPVATFPMQVNDLTTHFRLGDMASFVAVAQTEGTSNCQWRALSVEKCGNRKSALPMRPNLCVPAAPARVPGSQQVFTPMNFITDTPQHPPVQPPQHQITSPPPPYYQSPPHFGARPPLRPRPGPRPIQRPPIIQDNPIGTADRTRNGPLVGQLSCQFDFELYGTLSETIQGHGRVTYRGGKCSLLEDSETQRRVFFFNYIVRYHVSIKDRRSFDQGSVVYFEAEKTNQRANLNAYYEAKVVTVLEINEPRARKSRWDNGNTNGESSRSSSTSSSSITVSLNSGDDSERVDMKRRTILSPGTVEITMDSTNGNSVITSSCIPSPTKRRKTDTVSSEEHQKDQLPAFDARHRIQRARAKNYEIDRTPIDDKIEKVQFDRKPSSYGQLEAESVPEDGGKKGDSNRRAVLRTPPPPSSGEDFDLDAFMNLEEDFAQMYEFD